MKLFEEFRLYETMWNDDNTAIDEKEFLACLDRVNSNAATYSDAELDENSGAIYIGLTADQLKKALKIGSRGTYSDASKGKTIPAQLVELVNLEVLPEITPSGSTCDIGLELSGDNEETGESAHEYADDVPFVGFKTIRLPKITTFEEFKEYFNNTLVPNASKIANEIIENEWKTYGFTDYAGITSYIAEDDFCEEEDF